MNNELIAATFKKTAELLELHGENPFKIRSYSTAAFHIDKLKVELSTIPSSEWANLEGIGKSLVKNIQELLETGSFSEFITWKEKTPDGVFEMLDIKGIGPKKVAALWKELNILNKSELKKACEENRVSSLAGFGKKTQEAILNALAFEDENMGKYRIDDAQQLSKQLKSKLEAYFPTIEEVGAVALINEIVEEFEFLAVGSADEKIISAIEQSGDFEIVKQGSHPFCLLLATKGELKASIKIHFCKKDNWISEKIVRTSSDLHLTQGRNESENFFHFLRSPKNQFKDEESAYRSFGHDFIPNELRATGREWDKERREKTIQWSDIKGVFHNHSTYSDGKNSLEEMLKASIAKGWEYFGIADHSVSAKNYAGGLDEEEIEKQHTEINSIQERYPNAVLFKGIESDILGDGSLDYSSGVLASFDYVVASIHSGLKMDEEKAMSRLIKAIENPYTTMLGHMTGRLIAKRKGYPVNHRKIIDACAANGVIIELNSSPWRLDIDWREIEYCIEKGVKISLNPDAHEISGLDDTYYGYMMARKALLPKELCFNSLTKDEVANYFSAKKNNH